MSTPRFEISKSVILEKFDLLNNLVDVVSYSSKTNPLVSSVLEDSRDCWFSIHLVNELKNIQDCSRVLFFVQGWNVDLINELLEKGVKRFVIDNESDLNVFLDCVDRNVELFLRIKLKENTLRTEKYFVFGMNKDVVCSKLLELKNHKFISKLGVHFHRKTQNLSEWDLKYELEIMLNVEVLELLDYINIGGGLPSVYANNNLDLVPVIFDKINEFVSWVKGFGIDVVIEPGRFIAAPAGRLIVSVIGVYENNIIVNASVYNTDMDALIVPVKLLVEGEVSKGKLGYVIKGVTPCSMDIYRYRVYLEKKVVVGDEIVFLNAGAYGFSSDFCDLDIVDSVLVD